MENNRLLVTWYLNDVLSKSAQHILDETIRLNLADTDYSQLTVAPRYISLVTTDTARAGLFQSIERFIRSRDILHVSIRTSAQPMTEAVRDHLNP